MQLYSNYIPSGFLLVLFYSPVSVAWSSTLPSSIQALKGSCVVIPCSFTFPGARDSWGRKFSVAWYQYWSRGYPEIYNSKSSRSVLAEYRGRTEVVGDLELGNCTLILKDVRREDAMSYYVWINPDSVSHRFYDVTVRLEVTDVPEQLKLNDPGLLTEGDRTSLACSALHTCPLFPPTITWNLTGEKAVTIQERLADGVWRTESGLNYVPSYKDHGKYLQCTATFPTQQVSRRGITLQVKYSPKDAVVSVVGNPTLKEGDSVTLRCSSHSNPPTLSYRWFFGPRKAPLKGAGTGPAVKLTNVTRDSGPYYCVAENDVGMGEDSLPTYLDVEYKPVILPEGNCTISRTGEIVTCYCLAEGNPVPGLEWHLPNQTIPEDFNSSVLQAASVSLGHMIVGELRGPASILANVSCSATNRHGPSQVALPTFQAGNSTLLFMACGVAAGGFLLFTLLGVVIFKVTKTRKQKGKEGKEEEEEEEDQTIYVNDGNGERKVSLKGEKPSDSKEEEKVNMYSKPKARGSPTTYNDLCAEAYETMERTDEDYENVPSLGPLGNFGNLSNWQPTSGTDQIYSNV
ncbi:myelin-associated glycoprotein-like isoform X2 [Eublepharis macularius]|uniref:Myelin-associated glycoprotein-like isoform X2 n=1 Tax=Eublepharis macularius TaxID=481883 RepID=A0AA97KHM4_EUBMA|nr:myelin-associated glycoprotein-like isoform X2 [Eublepharis macularius]